MNILDARFKYVSAAKTDIRKTFAKARKQIEQQKREQEDRVDPQAEAPKQPMGLRRVR